nr:immunoglobulin light chain junction region [Macaca mulatta]MOW18390.1 immunoglobulin light chain junction region [Macaca mulatta]
DYYCAIGHSIGWVF